MKNIFIDNLIFYILLFTPILVFPLHYDYYYLPKLVVLYFYFAFILTKWLLFEKNKINIESLKNSKLLLFYSFLLFLSTIFSEYFYLSLWGEVGREEGLLTLLLYIVLFVFASKYLYLNIDKTKVLLFVTSIVSVITIFQYFFLNPLKLLYPFLQSASRVTGTVGNQNFLGSFLVLFLPLAIWMFLYNRSLIYLVFSSLIYFSLLLTMTRGAWLGGFFSLLLLLVLSKNNVPIKSILKVIFCFSLITLVFDLLTNGIIIGRFITIGNDFRASIGMAEEYATSSGSQRIFIWKNVINLIIERPFLGWGPDTLGMVFTEKFDEAIVNSFGRLLIYDKAHNEYLQIAYASGIPALLTYLAFVFTVLKTAWGNLNKNPLMIPLFCSVIGYLIQAFFNISVVSVAYIFWIFLGALMYMANKDPVSSEIDTELLQ